MHLSNLVPLHAYQICGMKIEEMYWEKAGDCFRNYFSQLWVCSIKMKKANKGYQAWGSFLVKEAAQQMNC